MADDENAVPDPHATTRGPWPPDLHALKADSVYFLMFPGWGAELRSNRWHYATRWARYLPVVLIQPVQAVAGRPLGHTAEPRIPNCRVLNVLMGGGGAEYLGDALVQAGQVAADMAAHGFQRPILWHYYPHLAGLYGVLPAVARIMHATENYFDFDGLPADLLARHRAAVRMSDLVVCVSAGVAASIRNEVPSARIAVVTNGCDYREYARFRPDLRLGAARRGYARVAIYAGNINSRLDLPLLRRCADEFPETLFTFFGPVTGLTADGAAQWRALLGKPNTRHFGSVDPDRLADLYGAADVGIIPYRRTRLLVENGFPLKALEMCATGLPVVSTLMKPIQGLTPALVVAADEDDFVTALRATSRSALPPEHRADMDRVCREHDYDRKFAAVLAHIGPACATSREAETRLDAPLLEEIAGTSWSGLWLDLGRQAWQWHVDAHRSRFLALPGAGLVRGVARKIALLALTGDLVLREPPLRHLLREWYSTASVRRMVALRVILKDLLRLGLALRPSSADAGTPLLVRYDANHRQLTLRSGACSETSSDPESWAGSPPGPITRVVWDHAALGPWLTVTVPLLGPVVVALGDRGTYEFPGVSPLAAARPAAVWDALARCRARTG